jgi:hypothetical protein
MVWSSGLVTYNRATAAGFDCAPCATAGTRRSITLGETVGNFACDRSPEESAQGAPLSMA